MEAAAAPSEAAAPSKKRPREADTAPLPDELALPSAAIMRIVKSKLPEGMMVGSDTKKAFGKICSLFILYLSTMYARAGLNRWKERIHRSLPDPAAPSHVHAHTHPVFLLVCACDAQCCRLRQGEQPVDDVRRGRADGAARPGI